MRALRLLAVFGVLTFGCVSCERAAAQYDRLPVRDGCFFVANEPLHPATLRELAGWMSDSEPTVVAIDLDGGQHTNRWPDAPVVDHGVVSTRRNADGDWFSYAAIGVTRSGVHVVRTWDGSNGSGLFEWVMLFRVESMRRRDTLDTHERWCVRAVGQIALGDRTHRTVSFANDSLIIGPPAEGREPGALGPGTATISLADL